MVVAVVMVVVAVVVVVMVVVVVVLAVVVVLVTFFRTSGKVVTVDFQIADSSGKVIGSRFFGNQPAGWSDSESTREMLPNDGVESSKRLH